MMCKRPFLDVVHLFSEGWVLGWGGGLKDVGHFSFLGLKQWVK